MRLALFTLLMVGMACVAFCQPMSTVDIGDTIKDEADAKICAQRALLYTQQSNYKLGAYYFDKARKFYEYHPSPKAFNMLLLDLIGLYEEIGNYEASLQYGFEALAIAEKNHFSLQRTQALIRIAWTYFNKRKYNLSRKYIDQALVAAEKYSQENELATSCNLIGQLLMDRDPGQALRYLKKSMAIRNKYNNAPDLAEVYSNLGELCIRQMKYDSALYYNLKSDTIMSTSTQLLGRAYTLGRIGNTYTKLHLYKKAEHYLQKAESLADSINSATVMIEVLNYRRDLAQFQHDLTTYARYTKRYETLSDYIYNYSESNRILLMESLAEIEKKNSEILLHKARLENQEHELNLRRWQIFITGLGSVLVIVIAIILYKNFKSTKQLNLKIIEQNNDLTATQEEIQTQNEELVVKNEEISAQRDMIQEQRNILDTRNDELKRTVKARTKDLVQYIQQLEQFTFIASHNLRAPIARILGLGNLLDMNGLGALDHDTIHKALMKCTRELDTVITDLNSVLQVRENANIVLTPVSVFEEVESVKSSLENLIAENRAIIINEFPDSQFIKTYQPYFHSILHNVISNAIKYCRPDVQPVIRLEVTDKKKFVCLTVSDNGLGIDLAKHSDHLFMLYKRFHDHIDGKGLGLFMMKTQIMSLGGKVKVKSEVNSGTTFYLYFKKQSTY